MQSPTTGATASTQPITDSYTAVAASWTEISADDLHTDFVKVWLHITVVLFPIMTWLLMYICDPIQLLLGDKTWTKLEDEHTHGTIAALIQISAILTFFVFTVDVVGVYYTITSKFIAYDANTVFYLSTVTGLLVDIGAFVWVIFVLATSARCQHSEQLISKGSTHIKKLISTVLIAPLLCIANHLFYILIAFISDPFHAGSIAIIYVVSFFLYFFIFRQFYNRVALHLNQRPQKVHCFKVCPKCSAKGKRRYSLRKRSTTTTSSTVSTVGLISTMVENQPETDGKCNCFVPGPGNSHTPFKTHVVLLSLVTIGPLVALYEAILIILFFSLPITKSLEDAPGRLYSIYQGTGLIIVGLLTYNILLNPNPFSLTKTLDRLAKRFRLPETTNYWNTLSDEEKCAKVIVTLIERSSRKPLLSVSNDIEEDEVENADSEV